MLVDNFSKTINPINFGFDTAIPLTISFKKEAWLAGIRDKKLSSVASISEDFNEIRNFSELNYSNFFNGDFFSSKIIDNEVWFGSTGAVLIYNKEKDFFRTLGYEKYIPFGRIYFIENLRNKILIGSKKDLVIIDKSTKKIVNSIISNFVRKNNTYIDDLGTDKDNIYLISNNKLYQIDMDENINFSKLNEEFKFISVFVSNEIKYFVTDRGIINSENDSIIPSSLYFNYQINDIVEFKDYIFIGTNKGLIVYNSKYNRLNDFYNFSFLENIYDMEQIGKYLVLLSNSGLIKLNLQL
jgi:ligand-binding sensor domain-containing protein